LPTNNKIG